MIFDVDEAGFSGQVVDRSRQVPVVVDFWADWCGPCRALTPVLEKAALEHDGQIDLAKVDVDRNPGLATTYGIQGIPAVKAFRDGEVVDEFVGAQPLVAVEQFFDGLLPSEAEDLARSSDEESLRQALELEPGRPDASSALARILLAREDTEEALELVDPLVGDFIAAGLAARARLTLAGADPPGAFEAWDRGDRAAALDLLQAALAEAADDERRDLLRKAMVAIFTELGPDDALAREHRRRLATALY